MLYPASHDLAALSAPQLALKIARHSACPSDGCRCPGLRPPPAADLRADDTPGTGGPADPAAPADAYLGACAACGHTSDAHGADPAVGDAELARRARVAVRLDELLHDLGRLLDFDYTDPDIASLRRQMLLPTAVLSPVSTAPRTPHPAPAASPTSPTSPSSSDLSDAPQPLHKRPLSSSPQPPRKRRRLSLSPLTDDTNSDDNSDDDDKPLAKRIATTSAMATRTSNTRQRAAAQKRSVAGAARSTAAPAHAVAHTAPASITPPVGDDQAAMNAAHRTKLPPEDKLDEAQLDRLVTGVTVDTGSATHPLPNSAKPVKVAWTELRRGIIHVIPVAWSLAPRDQVILTNLKTLFQKQLPKMPREYIARLVYDENSRCLAIIKRGYKVVGGICFRPFPHRGFAEIVFFATTSVDQDKGYGAMLMDHFKMHIKGTYPGMFHFLTYADNYAVGYFKKQGFSKDITLDRARWAGYIKDYEGGTIMQCTMLREVNYLAVKDTVAQQREAVLGKIREMGRSHVVHPGLTLWRDAGDVIELDPSEVPGLRESGWTPDMAMSVLTDTRPKAKTPDHAFMERTLTEMQNHSQAWAFLQPVDTEEVADYLGVISHPMDLHTMELKLSANEYSNLGQFVADAFLIFSNSMTYNPKESIYWRNADKMRRWLRTRLTKHGVPELIPVENK